MTDERLLQLLAVYRQRGSMPDFRSIRPHRRAAWPWLAAAAAILVIIGAVALRPRSNQWTTGVFPRALRAGDVVNSSTQLRSREIGTIDVGAKTTLRFLGR